MVVIVDEKLKASEKKNEVKGVKGERRWDGKQLEFIPAHALAELILRLTYTYILRTTDPSKLHGLAARSEARHL